MLGQIHELWKELQIAEEERKRFQMTIHGVSKSALASCEAELTRLQRHRKRFSATAAQVAKLRNSIGEYWDVLGYSPDQRKYFAAMTTTPESELSYSIFRAHEEEVERLKGQVSGMRELANYVTRREEIILARTEYGVPDERTRLRIERELPKYTAILLNRIAKWEKETGLTFCWNGEPYLEHMRLENHEQRQQTGYVLPQHTQRTGSWLITSRDFGNRLRTQHRSRYSIDECAPSCLPDVEQLRRRRSDPQAPERPRWRSFIRIRLPKRDSPS